MGYGNVECGGTALNFLQIERSHLRRFWKQPGMYTSCVKKRCGGRIAEERNCGQLQSRDPKEFKECIGRTVDLITHNIGRGDITLVWIVKMNTSSPDMQVCWTLETDTAGMEVKRQGPVKNPSDRTDDGGTVPMAA